MQLFAIVRDRGGDRHWLSSWRDGWTDDLGDHVDFFDQEEATEIAIALNTQAMKRNRDVLYYPDQYSITDLETLGIHPHHGT